MNVRILYVMAVWGPAYVEKFLEIALPTLLAPGNLPGAACLAPSRFLVVTGEADVAALDAHPLFTYLKQILDVTVTVFDPAGGRYRALSRAHMLAARHAVEDQALAVFLTPDAIISDNGLCHIVDQAIDGARAVMVVGPRLVEESMRPLLAKLPREKSGGLSLPSRQLNAMAFAHLHPETKRYIWGSSEFTGQPHMCMWPVSGQGGYLVRAFHLHPLMIDFRTKRSIPDFEHTTIDGDLVGLLVGSWHDIRVIDDSDRLAVYSLTPEADRDAYRIGGAASVATLQQMAYRPEVNPLHRRFFSANPIRLHIGDLDAEWQQLEEETGLIAYEALLLTRSDYVGILARYASGRDLARLLAERVIGRVKSMTGRQR